MSERGYELEALRFLMHRPDKTELIELHRTHWSSAFVWFGFIAFLGVLELAILGSYLYVGPWLTVPLILLTGHVMHAHVIAFHEAAHRTLCPNRLVNDSIGIFVGMLSFMSFTLYRVAHHSHHSYLATERDDELWPFVDTGKSRLVRFVAAFFELCFGLVFTPLLFMRSFLRRGSLIRGRSRIQVWLELSLVAAHWGGILTLTAWTGKWDWLLVLYVAPAWLSGNLQSIRKYIEHMGLFGSTVLGSTRSVIAEGPVGRLISFSMFNVPYHGIHHKYARLPQNRMPELGKELDPTSSEDTSPYTNYWKPFCDMVRGLANPRIGAQWLAK